MQCCCHVVAFVLGFVLHRRLYRGCFRAWRVLIGPTSVASQNVCELAWGQAGQQQSYTGPAQRLCVTVVIGARGCTQQQAAQLRAVPRDEDRGRARSQTKPRSRLGPRKTPLRVCPSNLRGWQRQRLETKFPVDGCLFQLGVEHWTHSRNGLLPTRPTRARAKRLSRRFHASATRFRCRCNAVPMYCPPVMFVTLGVRRDPA